MRDEIIKALLLEYKNTSRVWQRNLLKEYFQVLLLSFIYTHPYYSQLVFYGGSCLKHCFGLPRLSEDLDFIDLSKELDLNRFKQDLLIFCEKKMAIKPVIKIQKFRLYLKFPILHKLKVAESSESKWLYLKIEVFKGFECQKYKIETIPIFKYNHSILIRTFNLPTLMATKVMAILNRKWKKKDKQGRVIIRAKGRDYFDLMWYLDKAIKPNIDCIKNINSLKSLKTDLSKMVSSLDEKSIRLDLLALIENEVFVNKLSQNLKTILIQKINTSL